MRLIFLIILIHFSLELRSQIEISAKVSDFQTGEALSFCSITIQGTNKGTITNADGFFVLTVNQAKDVIVISFLGYESKMIEAEKIMEQKIILLKNKNIELSEITVIPDNDYLAEVISNCRNKLLKNKKAIQSKVYYCVETNSKTLSVEYPQFTTFYNIPESLQTEIPVELLECFYNSNLNGITINELQFKNGRTALAAKDNYFVTHHTSKAITNINLLEKYNHFPLIPLQLGKKALNKNFKLELQQTDSSLLQIAFYPVDAVGFKGKLWINKNSNDLIKISLQSQNSDIHPFLPRYCFDTIKNVSISYNAYFKKLDDCNTLDHIDFSYSFTYISVRDTLVSKEYWQNLHRQINSSGIMYFYDFGKPFILPYFEYDDSYDDYRKMSFIPYNKKFWENNTIMLMTEKQRINYGVVTQQGNLTNFYKLNDNNNQINISENSDSISNILTYLNFDDFSNYLFEFKNIFWSAEKRVIPQINSQKFETFSKEKIQGKVQSDLYNLKVQILLDIAEVDDSLICNTFTVFDSEKTFYHLPMNEYFNAFINIYFDLCEIERRKMQTEFDSYNFSLHQIDSIYKSYKLSIEKTTSIYLKEVEQGKNEKNFRKWNNYIKTQIGIDNIQLNENSIPKSIDFK